MTDATHTSDGGMDAWLMSHYLDLEEKLIQTCERRNKGHLDRHKSYIELIVHGVHPGQQ